MGLPTQKQNRRSKKLRASHFALTKKATCVCSNCGANRLPHTACQSCGNYRGKKTVDVEKKAAKLLKKKAK